MKKVLAIIIVSLLFVSMFSIFGFSPASVKAQNSGLVGYWKFDEGSGTTASDSSGNGNTGTLINGPAWVNGVYGDALSFDGSSNYMQIPDSSSLDVTAQVTVEAWVYPRAYVDSSGNNPHIVSRCGANGGHIYVLGIIDNKVSYSVNPSPNAAASAANLALNAWTFLAMTYDGFYVSLYINGSFDSDYGQSGSIVTTTNWLAIGCKPTAPHGGPGTYAYFNGEIDDVRIYNTALTQQEIQTDMGSARATYSVTLTAGSGGSISYSYSGGSGTVLSNQPQQLTVSQGDQISLSANPDSTHVFQSWSTTGAVSISRPSSASTTATIDGNGGVTANFNAPSYSLTFKEKGLRLPSGANWVVTLDGPGVHDSLSSGTDKIIFNVPQSVYTFSVTAIAGYSVSPASGSVTINGAGIVELITFNPVTLKGISSVITGATSLVGNNGFMLQQNFYLYTGNKDAQNNWEVYWCQNCVEMNLGTFARASMFIWNCYWEGDDIYVNHTTGMNDWFDACPGFWYNSPLSTMVFKSYIGTDDKLHMENDIAWFTWVSSKLVLTSNAYITCDFVSNDVNVVAPNFVIVGPANGGEVDFSGGAGTVTCQTTMGIGGNWETALNLGVVGSGQSTGESSTGLNFSDSQGRPTGDFEYQAGEKDQGIFFGIDPNGQLTPAAVVGSVGAPAKTLIVTVQCPVYLDLYDGLGNCVGYNATSGTVENQIGNAVWGSNQTILVFNPSGTYSLVVTGTENGPFTLETLWQDISGATFTMQDFNGTITNNATQAYAVGANAKATLTNIASKTVVGQGFNLQVNATVADLGGPNATCDVTLSANDTTIGTQSALNLSGWNSTTACFTWNTTGVPYGNYTLWANTASNNCTGGWVIVSIPGDIAGKNGWPDGKVDMKDIATVAAAFGSRPADGWWNANADINNDMKVDMKDIAIVNAHFGNTDP